MTTFNSIWATSLNQASILQKSNSKLSLGGLSSTSTSGSSGLLWPVNAAKGQQGPLDILMSMVGKSVSDVMSGYKPTQGMSFANSFKSAFSLSPFQQTSMSITGSIASNSISNLSKGIFSEATSAMSMTRREKENLMTTLLSGVNLGFLNSKSLLQSQGLLTEMIQESLNNIQKNTYTNIGGYYDSVIGSSLDVLGAETTTQITPPAITIPPAVTTPDTTPTDTTISVTPPPAITPPEITTPDTTTTVTPPDITTTTALEIETPQEDATEITEEGTTTIPNVSAEETEAETLPMQPPAILKDPAVQEILDNLKNQVYQFGTGTFTDWNHHLDFRSDAKGIAHSTISTYGYNPETHNYNTKYLVDGEKEFDNMNDVENYIDSLGAYSIKDGSGNTHELKMASSGATDAVELDGVEMSSSQLLEWAKDNGLEVVENRYDRGKTYYAIADTPNGSAKRSIVRENADGSVENMFEHSDEWWADDSSVFIKDGDGRAHNFLFDYAYNGTVTIDGKEMTADEAVKWAEDNGLEKVTITENGNTIEAWYADMITSSGDVQAHIVKRVNGVADIWGTGGYESTKVTTSSGDTRYISEAWGGSAGNFYTIDGKIANSSDVADILKESTNLDKTSMTFDGVTYDTYSDKENSYKSFTIDTSSGKLVDAQYYEKEISIVGEKFVQKTLVVDGSEKSVYEKDGSEITLESLISWGKENGLETYILSDQYKDYIYMGENEKAVVLIDYPYGNSSTVSLNKMDFVTNGNTLSVLSTYSNYGARATGYQINGENVNGEQVRDWLSENGEKLYSATDPMGNNYEYYATDDNKAISVNMSTGKISNVGFTREIFQVNETSKITYQRLFTVDGTKESITFDGPAPSIEELNNWAEQNNIFHGSGTATDGENYNFYALSGGKGFAVNNETGEKVQVAVSGNNVETNGNTIKEINVDGLVSYHQYEVNGNKMSKEEMLAWAKDGNLSERVTTGGRGGAVEIKQYTTENGAVIISEADGMILNNEELQQFLMQIDPLTLDLNGDGIQTVSAEQGVQFDLLGNGQKVQTGWTAGGDDAFLALDRDNSGAIESGKELFGNQHGAANGYEELAKFDDNNDGVIDSRDKVYANLKLWNDANMNGVSEAGELRSLSEAGVASISTGFKTSSFVDAAGNQHRQVSSFTKTNGQSGITTDLWFRYYGITSYINNQYPTAR